MQKYEYKVLPAPQKGTKARGVKTVEGRFANSIEKLLNQMGLDGWEYQRAELLPSEERTGLTGSTVNWRNVLVFRRAVDAEARVIPVEDLSDSNEPVSDGDENVPQAKPIPGPDAVKAPDPISEEADEPPLTKQRDDAEEPEAEKP